MSGWRGVLASLWTALCVPATYFVAGLSMMGDCTQPVEPCFADQRFIGWTVLALGVLALVGGYWLIFRVRRS